MPAPLEVIVGPAEVYVAPVGEAFPDINDVPGGNWELVGTVGSERYGEGGVTLRSTRDVTAINALGTTTPIKHVITSTGFQVEYELMDATLEQLALGYGLDPATITDTPAGGGEPGDRAMGLPTSPTPFQRAVLVRVNQSPYMENGKMQFEIFAANQVGNAEGAFSKGAAFTVTHIWDAVKTASGFVNVRAQDAAVSP